MTRNFMLSDMLAETLHGLTPGKARAVPRRRRRLAGLTAGALALSVVVSSAMPVRANDNDDLVAALAALALLGVILNESNNDPAPPPPPPPPRYGYVQPYPYPVRRNILPPVCAIEVEARDHRTVVVYAESCLDRYDLDRLPQRCAHEIRVRGNRDWVYGQACLRDAGFRPGNDFRSHERPD